MMTRRTEVGGEDGDDGRLLHLGDVGLEHRLGELLALRMVAHDHRRVRLRVESRRRALLINHTYVLQFVTVNLTHNTVERARVAAWRTCVRRRISASVFSGMGVGANALTALRARMTSPKVMMIEELGGAGLKVLGAWGRRGRFENDDLCQ